MYSPASSSGADTVLPTPNQPYSSRRGSLNSPEVADGSDPMSPTSPHIHLLLADNESKSSMSFASIPPPSVAPQPRDAEHATTRHERLPSAVSMSSSLRRANTGPSTRAPPPPPILLRRPSDVNGVSVEDFPLRTGSSTGSASNGVLPSPRGNANGAIIAARGLNIAGIPSTAGGSVMADAEEEMDALPALPEVLPSPRRAFFAHADPTNMPKSPAWQSFEVSPRSPAPSPSSGPLRRGSTDHVFSPLGPKGNGASAHPRTPSKFDPTPQHGIHARNLSLFFPSPATDNDGERRLSVPLTPQFLSTEDMSTAVMPAGMSSHKRPFGGAGEWSFRARVEQDGSPSPAIGRSKRRGHHVSHRHLLQYPGCQALIGSASCSTSIHYLTTSSRSSIQRRRTPLLLARLHQQHLLYQEQSTRRIPCPCHSSPRPPSYRGPLRSCRSHDRKKILKNSSWSLLPSWRY